MLGPSVVMPFEACQCFDQLVRLCWLRPYDAYPTLSSFNARLLMTCVNEPMASVLYSSLLLVAEGWLAVPAPNGSSRSEWDTLPITRIFGDSCSSRRTPPILTFRMPSSSTLNFGYGVCQIDVSGW